MAGPHLHRAAIAEPANANSGAGFRILIGEVDGSGQIVVAFNRGFAQPQEPLQMPLAETGEPRVGFTGERPGVPANRPAGEIDACLAQAGHNRRTGIAALIGLVTALIDRGGRRCDLCHNDDCGQGRDDG